MKRRNSTEKHPLIAAAPFRPDSIYIALYAETCGGA
jgi:hypothetical protein